MGWLGWLVFKILTQYIEKSTNFDFYVKDLYWDTQVTKYFERYVKMFVMNQGIQISRSSSVAWDMGQNVEIGESI